MHLTIGLILIVIPFRWIPRVFGSRQFETRTQAESRTRSVGEEAQSRIRQLAERDGSQQSKRIELIRRAVQRAGVVSPWRNRCLVSSLAGRRMLRRRKINSQLSLGVAKDAEGTTIAHAWLKSGGVEIVPGSGDYTEMYTF